MSWLPLEGIKVADFSALIPGPFATAILSDLGAEVIKIEPPWRNKPGHDIGYAKEYHAECYLRESPVGRIAPIRPLLILCFIAEKVLGLPKSY